MQCHGCTFDPAMQPAGCMTPKVVRACERPPVKGGRSVAKPGLDVPQSPSRRVTTEGQPPVEVSHTGPRPVWTGQTVAAWQAANRAWAFASRCCWAFFAFLSCCLLRQRLVQLGLEPRLLLRRGGCGQRLLEPLDLGLLVLEDRCDVRQRRLGRSPAAAAWRRARRRAGRASATGLAPKDTTAVAVPRQACERDASETPSPGGQVRGLSVATCPGRYNARLGRIPASRARRLSPVTLRT